MISQTPISIIPGPAVIIFSGASGSGKTTLVKLLLELNSGDFKNSVSVTTRAPRPGEKHGVDYFFVNVEEFWGMARAGKFLEWEDVHGNMYGTLLQPVLESLGRGEKVLLPIDVKGEKKIRKCGHELVLGCRLSIFINPANFEELEGRLRRRAQQDGENEKTIQKRLLNARDEIAAGRSFDEHISSITGNPYSDYLAAVAKINSYIVRRPGTKAAPSYGDGVLATY